MSETLRAHCGACAGLMVLITDDPGGYWYVCQECGETTARRPTAAEAAEDVVWVPAKQRRRSVTPPADNPGVTTPPDAPGGGHPALPAPGSIPQPRASG
jgi:hypothetical protein